MQSGAIVTLACIFLYARHVHRRRGYGQPPSFGSQIAA
jgi:hypothetical protein